jgi:uncharacterized protein YPO0396
VLEALFGRGAPRDERHAAALAKVERLLGDEAGFEDFQDYRNYYTFDLLTRDIESGREMSFERRRGVASGAERQVPFYVIIGAALASLYHGSRRSGAQDERGIGLAMFDEAFSKMDGPNQRTLLEFYGDVGLQVLIAARRPRNERLSTRTSTASLMSTAMAIMPLRRRPSLRSAREQRCVRQTQTI